MQLSLLVCFIAIVGFASVYAQQTGCVQEVCPRNERYLCCGSCVQRTCALEDESTCPSVCYRGCYCKKGFVRKNAPNGLCVQQKYCPQPIPTKPPSKK